MTPTAFCLMMSREQLSMMLTVCTAQREALHGAMTYAISRASVEVRELVKAIERIDELIEAFRQALAAGARVADEAMLAATAADRLRAGVN